MPNQGLRFCICMITIIFSANVVIVYTTPEFLSEFLFKHGIGRKVVIDDDYLGILNDRSNHAVENTLKTG